MAFDNALQNVDALFRGEGDPLPSTSILDYIYGIAAYKAWRSNRVNDFIMDNYRKAHYTKIPPKPSAPPDDMDTDVTSGPEDCKDTNCIPPGKQNRHTPTRRSGLEETMDELNMFLMYIHGITPEMAAERRQKKIEREERAAQEASRSKVMEWRNHLDVY